MRYKILTVDDSKTVRIIVRKAFKGFDCDIIEAANGVEGLAMAAKDRPDLILLDVTMPVMDGVEMLTKLKADPLLKSIPVMMLTAEGGREHVLKIAKIGVRDYIVKPFKEDVLVDKTGRIIDLKPLTEGPARVRTVLDALELLVVEDKPAIVQQIQDGLKHLPWIIQGTSSIAEAQLACGRKTPDLLLISLSLPEEGAFNFLRLMRNSPKTKYTPAFGLVVKTELEIQAQAQQVGFSAIITKPIDMADLETKAAKAMNLDTSMRYFRTDGEYLVMSVPENCLDSGFLEAGGYLKGKLAEAVDAGQNKAIFDVQAMRSLQMGLIKLLMQAMHTARELGIQHAVIGNAQLIAECKAFEDTKGWTFHLSAEEAKAAMVKELVGA
jgi:two-component system cell cycle response regulator